MTEREKMIAGESYNPADKELEDLRFNARILTEEYNKTSIRDKEKKKGTIKKIIWINR